MRAPTVNEAVGALDVTVLMMRAGKTRGVFNTADQIGGQQPLAPMRGAAMLRHNPPALARTGPAPPQLLARLRAWKRADKPGSTLVGFANVSVLWGGEWFEADDCPVSTSGGKAWAIFAGWPVITADGFVAKIPGTSKPRYVSKFRWGDPETQRRFSDAVVALVRARDPQALP